MIWNCPHCQTGLKLKTDLIVGVPTVAECLVCKGLAKITLEIDEETTPPPFKGTPKVVTPPPFRAHKLKVISNDEIKFSREAAFIEKTSIEPTRKRKVSPAVILAVTLALVSGAYLIYQSKKLLTKQPSFARGV